MRTLSKRISPEPVPGVLPSPGFPGQRLVRLALFPLMVIWLLPAPAWGAEWSLTPRLSMQLEYNDNIRLRTGPHDSVLGRKVGTGAVLAVSRENFTVRLAPRLQISRYPKDSSLDTNDQYLDFSAVRATERLTLTLQANLTRDTTLTSEAQETGRFFTNKRRESANLSPSLTWAVTELDTLRLGLSYTSVDYKDSVRTGLFGYNYAVADASLSHQLSETDSVSAIFYASRYRVPDSGSVSTSLGIQGGYTHAFSETLNGTARAGVIMARQKFKLEGEPQNERGNGMFFNAGLSKQLEAGSWEAKASRTLTPTSSGYLVGTDEVQLHIRSDLKPRLTGNLSFTGLNKEALGSQRTASNRRYARLGAGVRWRLTRWWSLKGDYAYVWQEHENAARAAESNMLMVSLEYAGDKTAISR